MSAARALASPCRIGRNRRYVRRRASGPSIYAYVGNNPLSDVDPLGLWAFTLQGYGLYGVLGGGIVVAGTGFSVDSFSLRLGAGKGSGVSFNPKGGKPAENAPCHSNSFGVFAEAELGKGPFSIGAGVNSGFTLDQNLHFSTYGGWEPEYGLGSSEGAGKFFTLGVECEEEASAGVEFTHTFH